MNTLELMMDNCQFNQWVYILYRVIINIYDQIVHESLYIIRMLRRRIYDFLTLILQGCSRHTSKPSLISFENALYFFNVS